MPRKHSVKNTTKPRIAIVGSGSLAGVLAVALRAARYTIVQIIARDRQASLRRARRLADGVGASAITVARVRILADVVWFCVPDGAIAAAAEALKGATDWGGKVALHSSGALSSDELAQLRRRGAAVASVHPLMTFVRGSQPSLVGVPFAVEGDRKAVRVARRIVLDLNGHPCPIRKRNKAVYHAWGMFTSPLLVALLSATEQVAAAAGVPRKAAKHRMLPILRQTLANYESLGASEASSGPIVRGDVETVKKHLTELRTIPAAREVYLALVRVALRDLPAKNREALTKILNR
ncbi:MAG: Rossmann-like and DUF2520 domain-containing protein [Candidatus Sulfotelmatobacter sp.]